MISKDMAIVKVGQGHMGTTRCTLGTTPSTSGTTPSSLGTTLSAPETTPKGGSAHTHDLWSGARAVGKVKFDGDGVPCWVGHPDERRFWDWMMMSTSDLGRSATAPAGSDGFRCGWI